MKGTSNESVYQHQLRPLLLEIFLRQIVQLCRAQLPPPIGAIGGYWGRRATKIVFRLFPSGMPVGSLDLHRLNPTSLETTKSSWPFSLSSGLVEGKEIP